MTISWSFGGSSSIGCSDAEGEDEDKMGFLVVILSIVMGLKKNNLGNCEEKDGVLRDLRSRAVEWWKRRECGILVEIDMDIAFLIHTIVVLNVGHEIRDFHE